MALIAGWIATTLRERPELALFATLALGYTVPYAVGAIFLTIGGLVIVPMMS